MIKYTAILKNDATSEEVNNANLRVTVHISLYFEVIELAEDLEEFEEWLKERYGFRTVQQVMATLRSMIKAGVDINTVTEEGVRAKYWHGPTKQRNFKLSAIRRYKDFKNGDKLRNGKWG